MMRERREHASAGPFPIGQGGLIGNKRERTISTPDKTRPDQVIWG
jgi:hypothetical protein